MKNYSELKSKEPILTDCFFAFSNSQYAEGIKEHKLEGKKIFKADGGLFGTHEGIKALYDYYDKQHDEISKNCEPQDVYDYEFANHECGYLGNDAEAITLALSYFTLEQVKNIKRKYGYLKLEDIKI
jgi:hypothetical protein